MRGEHFSQEAMATKILIGINVAVFFLQAFLPPAANHFFVAFFGLSYEGLSHGLLWQPVTHMFLHGNLFHLLVNMVGLWFAGKATEAWIGKARYLGIFFIGGIAGGLLQAVSFPDANLIGASGGVCAILLVFTTLEPEMPITALLFFVIPVQLRAKFLGWSVIGLSLLLPLLGFDPTVGHFAHLGGALMGMGYALWLRKSGGNKRQMGFPPFFGQRVQATQADIEMILAKVMREGLHSLTPVERTILESWSRMQNGG